MQPPCTESVYERKTCRAENRISHQPGWCWLLAILFLFPLLPEYVSPFILFAGFIVFKVQWSREGRKAKVGTIGKMMMLFMGYAILSTLWSPTSFSTFSTAALWWGMFLLQVMIYNLARSRDKLMRCCKPAPPAPASTA